MLDILIKILGVLGFLLGCASFAWQMYTYRESRRERISIEVSSESYVLEPSASLVAKVRNAGRSPLFVEAVNIVRRRDTTDEQYLSMPLRCSGGAAPLQPGEGRRYLAVVSSWPPELATAFSQAPEADIWLEVNSPAGQIGRVAGREVLAMLRGLANGGKENGPGIERPIRRGEEPSPRMSRS